MELITALFSLGLFYYFGIKQGEYIFYGIYFFLVCLLIVATFVDFEFQIIPDEINIIGCLAGLAASFAYPALHERVFLFCTLRWDALISSVLGLFVGGGILYLVSSDTTADAKTITQVYQKRGPIEEYHKSLKSNTALSKSPTRTVRTQQNHFFASIYAYYKLEMLKIKTKLNHFALKTKLYVQALRASMVELQKLQLVT